jgi:hypothetical protein
MTDKERASLAEQLLANPLFAELFNGVERDATEAMIYAKDDDTRARAAMRVQAVRSLRDDCMSSLRATREPKTVL